MPAHLLVIAGVIYLGGLTMTTAYAWDKGYPVFPVIIATMFLEFPLPLLRVCLRLTS